MKENGEIRAGTCSVFFQCAPTYSVHRSCTGSALLKGQLYIFPFCPSLNLAFLSYFEQEIASEQYSCHLSIVYECPSACVCDARTLCGFSPFVSHYTTSPNSRPITFALSSNVHWGFESCFSVFACVVYTAPSCVVVPLLERRVSSTVATVVCLALSPFLRWWLCGNSLACRAVQFFPPCTGWKV